ncbi:hypothetical protein QBC36DRAFT_337307 [Triangularia setosa]|uniref:Uncharacterized protein n=1 Tax=Triangularia setosa TaxID=2587417 RepID=A0AAN6W0M6_9PEZI|nr:hypothetical protein QBC36DRAFT_337307 [Podospora setosa]
MSKHALPMPPPPPLLLTKRVTAFLRANLSPHIQAAMLTTPAGNLLAHASSLPASALRRQCAIAASIWAVQSQSPPPPSEHKTKRHKSSPALTVQLDSGLVFVIRRLKCGMLFVCMGGGQSSPRPSPPSQQQQQQQQNPSISAAMASPQPTPTAEHNDQPDSLLHPHPGTEGGEDQGTTPIGSPSANSELGRASVLSAGTTSGQTITSQTSTSTTTISSAGVVLMRRQVEELARWLDEKLGGLCIPEEGIGIDRPERYQLRDQLEIR